MEFFKDNMALFVWLGFFLSIFIVIFVFVWIFRRNEEKDPTGQFKSTRRMIEVAGKAQGGEYDD